MLSDSSKARRQRRNNLSIQITFLSWLIEVFGFFVIFLGQFLVGHGNIFVTQTLQTITILFYLVIVPSVYLVNVETFKEYVVDSSVYISFNRIFISRSSQVKDINEGPEVADENENNGNNEELNDTRLAENVNPGKNNGEDEVSQGSN